MTPTRNHSRKGVCIEMLTMEFTITIKNHSRKGVCIEIMEEKWLKE